MQQAIDFWRGRHLEDGTLTPTSPLLYQALVDYEFLPLAEAHCGNKVVKFLSSNFDSYSPPLSFAARNTPAYFLFSHFSLENNAVATSRRMRHQNKLSLSLVDKCFYCNICDAFVFLLHRYPQSEGSVLSTAQR